MSYKPTNPNGSATSANSEPVVIASDQSAVPVADNGGSLTVDYATTGSGTAAGALRVELPTNGTGVVGLNAGTNAIGKLAANSGIDIGDVDVTSVVPGTTATSLSKAEDAAHVSGDVGVMALAIRDDVLDIKSGTEGDYEPLHTTATGALWTEDVNAAATKTATQTIAGAVTAAKMQTDIVTLPALAAGTNLVGKVGIDQTTPGTTNLVALAANQSINNAQVNGVTLATGTGVMGTGVQRIAIASDNDALTIKQATAANLNAQVVGNVADAVADSGNPVKVGGKYNVTRPTYTDGQRGDLQINARGSLSTMIVDSTNANITFGSTHADAASNTINTIPVRTYNMAFNGTTWDRARNNEEVTLLASAARTTTQTGADTTNYEGISALVVFLDMTTVGTGSVTLTIEGKDTASGKYYTLLAGAAVTTNSTNRYRVGPDLAAVANSVGQDYIPRTFRINVTANNANSATYSVGYNLLRG